MERNSAFLLETSRLRAENDALEDTLSRWQAQCKKLEGDLASLHASFEELGTIKDRAQQVDGRNAYLQRKLLEAVKEAEGLRAELDRSRRELGVQNGLREHLQQQLDLLSGQLRSWEERHERLAKQLGVAQSSNVQLAAAESVACIVVVPLDVHTVLTCGRLQEAKAMLGEIRRRLTMREKELDASNAVRSRIQQVCTLARRDFDRSVPHIICGCGCGCHRNSPTR